MKIIKGLKEAMRSIVGALYTHKKKVIGGALLGFLSAYLYKKIAPYARKLKSTYDVVANFSYSMGSSKITAY